jgi:hypothetical protein
MRKTILTLFLASTAGLSMAQVQSPSANLLNKSQLNQAAPYINRFYDGTEVSTNINRPANPQQGMSAGRINANEVIVGTTTYDLQSNNSVQNRIKRYADGTIALGWTFSNQFSAAYADRGTGYNYFNGTSWGANPTLRIENARTGWPSVSGTDAGKEIIISHNTAVEKLAVTTRATKGTGAWANATFDGPTPDGNWWPRAAVGGANGQTIHLFSLTYPVANGGSTYQGQDGAITYSRSLNGGTTWDINHIVLPGMGSAFYRGYSADEYAIDVKGDVVAFVTGSSTKDVFLMKSVDNGTTWTKTVIWEHPIPMWDPSATISDVNNDGVADTISACDGGMAVIIDNNNVCHVTYGNMRYLNDDISSGGISFFPFTSGLLYWNENRGFACPEFIADLEDRNNNGEFDLPNGADIPLYYMSLTGFPSMSVDANNNLYVSYSGLVEGTDNGLGQPYRNVFVIKSADGGDSWTNPTNVVEDDFTEAVFASLDRNTDSKIRMVYQRDEEPGLSVRGDEDPISLNEIVYVEFDVTELVQTISPVLGSIDCINPCPTMYLTLTSTPDSCQLGLGTAFVTVDSGATAPFIYSWNTTPIQNDQEAKGLTSRTYTVNVKDSIGCVQQASVFVDNIGLPSTLTPTITATSACGSPDGAISISASGNAPFTYEWFSGSTPIPAEFDTLSTTFDTTFVDVYDTTTVIIDSTLLSTTYDTLSITYDTISTTPLVIDTLYVIDTLNVYDYITDILIDTTSTVLSVDTIYDLQLSNFGNTGTGLASGFYTISVVNGDGCENSTTPFVNDGGAPVVELDVTNVACFGSNTGSIEASVANPSGNETYTWNTGFVGATLSNLTVGTYSLVFNDGLCQSFSQATLTQPTALNLGIDNSGPSNAGANNGFISVTVSGGVSPYSYKINGVPNANGLFQDLNPGSYLIEVEDANGCVVSNNYSVQLNTVSVENEQFISDMNVYPNPVKENLNIRFVSNKSESIQIRMMNMNGQLVYQEQLNHFTGEYNKVIDMAGLSKGMYILQFVSDKDSFTKKVIKN